MGATSDFRKDLRNILLYYSSTLEAYNTSSMIHNRSDYDTIKVTKTPNKENDIAHIDVDYYVMKTDHIRILTNNQERLRLNLLVSLMSVLEKYLKNILKIAFRSAPRLFSNVKTSQEMELGSVIRLENYSNLTSSYLEKEVWKIGDRSLSETSDYFRKHLGIDFQTLGVRWERIIQISRYRNAIVHADSQIIHSDGETRAIQINHWSFLQIVDDLYDLSIYVGKTLREKISESKGHLARKSKPQVAVLFTIDSDSFDDLEEFKGRFRFQINGSFIAQLSDVCEIIVGTSGPNNLVIVKGDLAAVSAYAKFVKSRLSKSRNIEHYQEYIYREGHLNPVFTAEILENLEIAYAHGLDKDQIVDSYPDKNDNIIPVLEYGLRVIENLPSENIVREIEEYIDRFENQSWPQQLAYDIERHFMLPPQVVVATIAKLRAERIKRHLEQSQILFR